MIRTLEENQTRGFPILFMGKTFVVYLVTTYNLIKMYVAGNYVIKPCVAYYVTFLVSFLKYIYREHYYLKLGILSFEEKQVKSNKVQQRQMFYK